MHVAATSSRPANTPPSVRRSTLFACALSIALLVVHALYAPSSWFSQVFAAFQAWALCFCALAFLPFTGIKRWITPPVDLVVHLGLAGSLLVVSYQRQYLALVLLGAATWLAAQALTYWRAKRLGAFLLPEDPVFDLITHATLFALLVHSDHPLTALPVALLLAYCVRRMAWRTNQAAIAVEQPGP